MKLSKKFITCLLVLFSTVLLFTTVPLATSAEAPVWSDIQVAEEYSMGDVLTVPDRTLTVGGVQCANVYSIVTTPSGNATLNKAVTLSEAGKYKLAYTGVVNGRTYKTEQSIQVYAKVARLSSDNSSSWYGKNEEYSKNTSGLNVSLAFGDTLTFDTVIDLRYATKNDSIIKFFCTPEFRKQVDMEVINIVLTDIENPNNYLRIKIHDYHNGILYPSSYALAGGEGQALKGWEEGWQRLHVNNEWGTPFRHTFFGWDREIAWDTDNKDIFNKDDYMDDTYADIRYDAEEKAVYVKSVAESTVTKVMDLDDPNYFGTNLWGGFTSGRVKMEIYCEQYENLLANFCIFYVKDTPNLAENKSSDTLPPDVNILYPEVGTKIPTAKVGYYYPIFGTETSDNFFNSLDEKISVWYKESESAKFSVEVKDGAFKVDKAGTYIIRYKVTDGYGNVTIKEVEVEATTTVPPISLTLGSGGQTDINTGSHVNIVNATYSGGTGNLVLTYSYTFNDGERIPITKKGFTTDKAGTYKVYYTVTDYVGQIAEDSITVNVTDSDKPVFGQPPIVEKTFVSGSRYYLDDYYATVYDNGSMEQVLTTVTVTDSNGIRAVGADGFVPVVANSGDTVKLTYTATYNGKTNSTEVVVPAIIAVNGSIDIKNYFITHGVTMTKADNYTVITPTEETGGFTFIRAMSVETVTMAIDTFAAYSNLSGIRFVIEDSKDSDISVTVDVLNKGSVTAYRIGDRVYNFTPQTGFHQSSTFTIKVIRDEVFLNDIPLSVKNSDSGKPFRGFTSGYAYVSFEYIGASTDGTALVNLTNICGQPITSAKRDKVIPRIFITEDLNYTVDKGAYVNVPKAVVDDVICPNVEFTVSVKNSSGAYLTDIHGVSLNAVPAGGNYTFQVTDYGQYSIIFNYKDSNNQSGSTPISVNVEDSEPPTINFTDVFKETIKKGDVIIIPDFTVSDNKTAASNITKALYIRTSDGLLVTLSGNSNSLKTKNTGVYQILISVGDESGNILLYRKNITVTN